ncbi:MAG: hypothetical protein Q4G33_11580 [bacterium]|nr:hypothetical protein [bacterium]
MYAIDFEYDGRYLSDYGFIICDFNPPSDANIINSGSKLKFNTTAHNNGKKYSLTGTQYEECIQATFDICKNPDLYDDLEISIEEYRDIVRWLNRQKFLKFRIIDDENEFEPCYYEASFNVSKIKISEVLYGIELEMTTNRPFGFGVEIYKEYDFSDITKIHILRDTSDEIGYIYPMITITCYQGGNLTVYNDITGSKMEITNCLAGEVITINGNTHSITTTKATHDIYNNFNYDYFKIGNTINNRSNKISVSLPCKIELRYSPIIKNSPC